MAVVSIANPKGGAGKTTLCLVVADELARQGLKVGVVDADPHGFIDLWGRTRVERGDAVPFELAAGPSESAIIKTIQDLASRNDIVLIDLEGTSSRLTSRAIARSHLVLFPLNMSPMDAGRAADAVRLLQEEEEALDRTIAFRLIPSRMNAAIKTKSERRIIAGVAEAELPLIERGLVERAAYRDMFENAARLSELTDGTKKSLDTARANAQETAAGILQALEEIAE